MIPSSDIYQLSYGHAIWRTASVIKHSATPQLVLVLTSKPWCLPNAICGMVVEIWFITSYRIKQQMFVYVCLSTPGGWTSELAVLLLGMM